MSPPTVVPVGGERPYEVLVGRDLTAALPPLLAGAARVAVLHAAPLKAHAEGVADALAAAGVTPLPIEVPDAEAGKDAGVAISCWERLGAAGFTRTDAVVGVGGG
ncbi:MAG TPA: 3-dehydroquinate synthase, partial [Micromonosporaceae bacterium]|nr:3-dehydroquinate synthase [Micromonosporaceae bacterium]